MEKVMTMARKRERHYNETKTLVSVALIIIGLVSAICLIGIWPQKLLNDIFRSKLMNHLIIDVDDYWTCNTDYKKFVIDQPSSSDMMHTLFIFNITNAADIITAGNEPIVAETGPYGFVKSTFKYDIYFDPVDSLTISFKEYTTLTAVEDSADCERMYYRTGRDYLADVACTQYSCKCKSLDSTVIVVNPLYLKLLTDERAEAIFGQMSIETFKEIKRVMDEPFSEAVRAHLVTNGLFEVYQFRLQAQVFKMLTSAYEVLAESFSMEEIANTPILIPNDCALQQYGVVGNCPMEVYFRIWQYVKNKYTDLPHSSYPFITQAFNVSNPISFLHFERGLPMWVGLAYFYGYTDYNLGDGYTTVLDSEFQAMADDVANQLSVDTFGLGNITADNEIASMRMVQAIANFIGSVWIVPYVFEKNLVGDLVYDEFLNTYEPVPCSPLGHKCVYQWGYMQHTSMHHNMSADVAYQLIDLSTKVSTNPSNFWRQNNAVHWYNSHTYCTNVLSGADSENMDCTSDGFSITDGAIRKPAAIWAYDTGFPITNLTKVYVAFSLQPVDVRNFYVNYACNISSLLYDVYRTRTDFHDVYVVNFLNKYKNPLLKHNFSTNWSELGVVQWAGGYITESIAKVRSMGMITRDGMWRIGADDYWNMLLEYSSWCVKQGYTEEAFFDNYEDAVTLLNSLSDGTYEGYTFRKNIVYRGTTLIGDGQNYYNGIGNVGEYAYTPEYVMANFSCNGKHNATCKLLEEKFSSSAAYCLQIESFYATCTDQYTFQDNGWVDFDMCSIFQTSISSSIQGIQCNLGFLYGFPHPYTKSRGNIVYEYIRVLTLNLVFKDGLWCSNYEGCTYEKGGLFITTTARKLLFDGYTDPFLLKYMNFKHSFNNVSFQCVNNAFNKCGKQLYVCDDAGVVLMLPGDKGNVTIQRNLMPIDNYFAPFYEMSADGELLWRYSMNSTVASYAQTLAAIEGNTVIIANPFWAAYPAWNTNQEAFNKFYQCQKRFFSGKPNFYSSCDDVLFTGRDGFSNTKNIKSFHGNDTIHLLSNSTAIPVHGSTQSQQFPMHLYDGFKSYPYLYLGSSSGTKIAEMTKPVIFNKEHALLLTLSQESLTFEYERSQTPLIPYCDQADIADCTYPTVQVPVRVFVEDISTWEPLRSAGVSRDFYGMPLVTPIGTSSLERGAGFAVFAGTPHFYGNKDWGGREYALLGGLTPSKFSQRTFIDYDPVTGKALRNVVRQQIQFRIEANPLNPVLFSSQSRCVAPTKVFLSSTGYGCFTYIPFLWFEDTHLVSGEEVFHLNQHFYTRPDRAFALQVAGIVLVLLFTITGIAMFINEAYHRRKFMSRVYVD